MQPDDQSFADLMAICGERFGKTTENGLWGAVRPETWSTSLQQILRALGLYGRRELTMMLARLRLRQEDQLNALAMDRSFIVFLQCGKGSVMPMLLQTSKDWHHNRQTDGVCVKGLFPYLTKFGGLPKDRLYHRLYDEQCKALSPVGSEGTLSEDNHAFLGEACTRTWASDKGRREPGQVANGNGCWT